MSKLRLIFLIILIPFTFFQCGDEHPVPEVYVNFILEIKHPAYQPLEAAGNSVFIPNEGNRGIIVTNLNGNEFAAYDATCTHDPAEPDALVEIDGISGVCKKCGSKFALLLNAHVEKGPAGLPLKAYVTKYNSSTSTILIHN